MVKNSTSCLWAINELHHVLVRNESEPCSCFKNQQKVLHSFFLFYYYDHYLDLPLISISAAGTVRNQLYIMCLHGTPTPDIMLSVSYLLAPV